MASEADLSRALALEVSLPPLYPASAWRKKNGDSVAILLPADARRATRPSDWTLALAEKRYVGLAQALAFHPTPLINRRSAAHPLHVALTASLASRDRAADARAAAAPYTLESTPPPSPALFFDAQDETWIFVAHPDWQPWALEAGWRLINGFPATRDAFRAAALSSQATPSSRAAILAHGVPVALVAACATQPIGRPFLTFLPQTRTFRLYANASFADLAADAGFTAARTAGAWDAVDVASAIRLARLADPLLKPVLMRASAPSPLVETSEVSLAQLFEVYQDELERGAGSRPDKVEPTPRMTFSRRAAEWRTRNPFDARAAGFTPGPAGDFSTRDVSAAMKLRKTADVEAEIAIEEALAEVCANVMAGAPDPPDPEPPDGQAYSDEQIQAIRFAAKRKSSMNADDMGFGKTVIGCGLQDVLKPTRTLVLTLASNLESWRRHFTTFLTNSPPIALARADTIPTNGITVLPNTSLANATAIRDAEWDLVINDEAHKFKTADSQRSIALYDGLRFDRSIDLTGTPIPNKPQDLFNPVHLCLPEIFPDRELFHRLYGLARVDDDTPEKAILRRRLGAILYRTVLIRRRKNLSVGKSRATIEIDVHDPLLKARMAAELSLFHRWDGEQRRAEKTRLLAEITRMRRDTAFLKIPAAVDQCRLAKMFGDAFIVFGHHHDVLSAFAEEASRAGLDLLRLDSRTLPARARQPAIDQFQAGRHDGVVGGVKSIGTALTITRAPRVIFLELDWDPFDMIQAEDRAWRRGQTEDVQAFYIVVAGSIDAWLAHVNNEKIRIAADILDYPLLTA